MLDNISKVVIYRVDGKWRYGIRDIEGSPLEDIGDFDSFEQAVQSVLARINNQ